MLSLIVMPRLGDKRWAQHRSRRRPRRDRRTENHQWKLSLLRSFVEKQGWSKLKHKTVVAPGVRLGFWVSNRRKEYAQDRLAPWLIDELERIPGWSWDPRTDRHRQKLEALRAFVRRHGWDRFTVDTVTRDGLTIGPWVEKCRITHRAGQLDRWLVKELERIPGWSWDAIRDSHRRTLGALKAYVKRRGWGRVTHQTRVGGINLGQWVQDRRRARRRGVLEDWLRVELEAIPGWTWHPLTDAQRRNLDLLTSMLASVLSRNNGHTPIQEFMRLARWLQNQREIHRRGTLADEVEKALEIIPGWHW